MKKKNKQTKKYINPKSKLSLMISKVKPQILNCSLEKGILLLDRVSKKKIVFLLTINFLCGITILSYTKTLYHFFPHLICLTLNIIITLTIGSEYANTILFLDKKILKNVKKENIELREIYKQFRQKAFHILNLIFCIVVLSIFFWGIFSQHYIELNLVGCYAVYMVFITVSISVIGYVEYLWILWFLYRVSNCSSMPYNKMIPAHTPFLVKMGTLTKHVKWCFFIEGFLYVFEYFILIPTNNVTLLSINMPNNFSFLVTWGIIFVVIILAFPVLIYTQEYFLSTIIRNLKAERIENLSYKFNVLIEEDSKHFPEIYMCNWIINNLLASPDYPVKIQRLGPAVVAITTFLIHLVNLINQYPELKNFLINRLLGGST